MRRSKYLRISIRSMLVVTGMIAVATWWIQWPSITASNFARDPWTFVANGRLKAPTSSSDSSKFLEFIARDRAATLDARSRSVREWLLGEQIFDCGDFEFTVVRGAIKSGPRYKEWPTLYVLRLHR